MTELELVRQEVISAFKTVHEANYPTTLVNYPDYVVVDIEHQKAPFISLHLDLSAVERAALGEGDLLVPGALDVIYYYRSGRGSSGKYTYTDMLNANLGMKQFGSIRFHAVKPMNIETFPGWKGLMNRMRFDLVEPLNC